MNKYVAGIVGCFAVSGLTVTVVAIVDHLAHNKRERCADGVVVVLGLFAAIVGCLLGRAAA